MLSDVDGWSSDSPLRVYPACEGATQDRLCRRTEDGDPGSRNAETRQSATILKRNTN